VDATRILDAFYPGASAAGAQVGRARRVWSAVRNVNSMRRKARKWTPYLVIGSLLAVAWLVAHLYYYNLLVDLDFNVKASWAQVEVQLERRYHIQQNLARIVMGYSEYEKEVLTALIELRTSSTAADRTAKATAANDDPAAKPTLSEQLKQLTKSELNNLFPDILVVAEQYPELKLTENYQQFSTAIIDTETLIAERITEYNIAVNDYTTTRTQFPGNIFAAIFNFEMSDFYEPDKDLLDFEPVEY